MKPRILVWALLALAVFQSIYFYPQFPDTMASHFDGSGQPNGWSTKPFFFGLNFMLALLMFAISRAVPALVERYPQSTNIPNRDYWLSSDRLDETIAFLRDHFAWFGVGALTMMLLVIQLVIQTNLRIKYELPSNAMWLLIGGYV